MNLARQEDEMKGLDQASCDIFRTGVLVLLLDYHYNCRPRCHNL